MEELGTYIDEQEGKIEKHVEYGRYKEEDPEIDSDTEDTEDTEDEPVEDAKEKKYRLAGPDFRKKEIKVEENKAVMEFQKSGDLTILENLYMDRIPTLNYWARKKQAS